MALNTNCMCTNLFFRCLPDQIFQDIDALNSEVRGAVLTAGIHNVPLVSLQHIQQESKTLSHIVEKHIITGSLDGM